MANTDYQIAHGRVVSPIVGEIVYSITTESTNPETPFRLKYSLRGVENQVSLDRKTLRAVQPETSRLPIELFCQVISQTRAYQ